MDSPRIAPRLDATPDTSRAAVARCYAYLVERRRLGEQKEGGPETAPNSAKGGFSDSSANGSISRSK